MTPPPSYQSNEDDENHTPGQHATLFRWVADSLSPSRPSSSGSATPAYVEEPDSGIQRKYADTGFAMLRLAQSEESSIPGRSSLFVRGQYIGGVACMLRGLPANLTLEEEQSLREALPATLAPPNNAILEDHVTRRPGGPPGPAESSWRAGSKQPSILQRWVASATCAIFLAVSLLLPYIQNLLRAAWQFDRKHRISDKFIAGSMVAADVMGKRTMTIATHVCQLNDGKVGESFKDVGVYFVQGFSGGVYDGLGEGMQVLGLRAKNGYYNNVVLSGGGGAQGHHHQS